MVWTYVFLVAAPMLFRAQRLIRSVLLGQIVRFLTCPRAHLWSRVCRRIGLWSRVCRRAGARFRLKQQLRAALLINFIDVSGIEDAILDSDASTACAENSTSVCAAVPGA